MSRMISSLLIGVFVLLAMAIPAEAQGRRYRYQEDQRMACAQDPYCARYLYHSPNDRYNDRRDRYDRRGNRRHGSVGPFIAGAVVGVVTGAVIASRNRGPQQPVVQQNGGAPGSYPEQVSQQPVAGPAANAGEGEFELANQTRVYVEAYDGKEYIGRMAPGATLAVGPPQDRYRGYALLPNKKGGLSKEEVELEPGDSGWTFVEPQVAQGR